MAKSLFLDVFISYSRRDKEFVRRLVDSFETANRQVWVDWEDIEYAEDWWAKIQDGIERSDNFIFVLTPESVRSKYCFDEVEHAHKTGKRIIPIVVETVKEDDDFAAMHPAISQHNWMPFPNDDNFNASFGTLIKTIDTDPQHVRLHTRLMNRAREWEQYNKQTSRLLMGEEISEAEQWLAKSQGKQPIPTGLQAEFILASRAQQRERGRRLLVGVSIALAMTVVLAVIAIFQSIEANRQAEIARQNEAIAIEARNDAERRALETQSLALASRAQSEFDNRPALGLALALEANEIIDPPRFSRQTLADAAYLSNLRDILTGHVSTVYGVAVLPDGTRAISASDDTSLILWDLTTGEEIRQFTGHSSGVYNVVVSADGQRALSASFGGDVILWDIESGEIIRVFAHGFPAYDAVFSPDETRIYVALDNGTVVVWDIQSEEMIGEYFLHDSTIFGLDISDDGTFIATASGDGWVTMTDAETGEVILDLDAHQGSAVLDVDISPDGNVIASAGTDSNVALWFLDSEFADDYEVLGAHEGWVLGVRFDSTGEYILSSAADNSVELWSVYDGSIDVVRFGQHTAEVYRTDFLPDGSGFVSVSVDGTLMLWDLHPGDILGELDGHDDIVRDVAISPDGTRALTAGWDNIAILWDLTTHEALATLEGHDDWLMSVAFSPDGRFALTAGTDNRMILWNLTDDDVRQISEFEGHSDWIRSVIFMADGERAVSASGDGTLILWDLTTGEALRQFRGHERGVLDVDVSPDGTLIASAGEDGTVRLWNLTSNEAQMVLEGHEGSVHTVHFMPDGLSLVSGSSDTTLIRWDVATGDILNTYSAHENTVEAVDISADGELMISVSGDRTFVLWDLASATPIRTVEAHDDSVTSVSFAPDSRSALTGSRDRKAKLWRTDTLDSLKQWTCENREVAQFTEDDSERFPLFDIDSICDEFSG